MAAHLAATPEASPHTSIKARIDHCAKQGQLEQVRTGNRYSLKQNVETGLWLLPIQNRRNEKAAQRSDKEQEGPSSVSPEMAPHATQHQQPTEPAARTARVPAENKSLRGMLQGISLRGYLEVSDWSRRLVRPGQASVPTAAPPILERLRINEANWSATLQKLIGPTRTYGSHFGSTSSLNEAATAKVRKYLKNITGRDTALTPDHSE